MAAIREVIVTNRTTEYHVMEVQHMQNSVSAWHHRFLYSDQTEANSSSSVFKKMLEKSPTQ